MPTPLYYSHSDYVASGSNANFAITFDYLDQADINVYVNGVLAAFSFLTPSTVQLAVVPGAGQTVIIRRTTPITELEVLFADGSTLSADDMDRAAKQALFAIQELQEQLGSLQAQITSLVTAAGNLPPVTGANNGQILQVVGGVWTLVATSSVTVVQDEQVDGANRKLQKKTVPILGIGAAPTVSGWTDIHTGTSC